MPNVLETVTFDTLLQFNKKLGIGKVLSRSLVESSLSSWHYYDDPKLQICSVFRGILKNHGFVDGNKRTATVFLFTYCELLDLEIKLNDDEFFDFIVEAADAEYEVEELATRLF